ncbi:nitroreductase family protein [Sulfobacillus harzensis]|uniref:Putative NAD(P)H nitroreductase n=1 Tax=Sulfobacillus harzensis TaxID=2729629 RepID=A0A7Y0L5M2_9FIRM|nr:nitroreductase [Sulfobacillus harzensis]NMP23171.1 nitroreductase [Sulfobacillus harzensis]
MLIEEAIRSRASIKVFSEKEVSVDLIERCLDAAVWAPNHHLTEPWSFHVVTRDAREMLARIVKEEMVQRATGIDAAVAQAKAFKERQKLFSAPAIVAVYSDAGRNEKATQENFAASAAAAQNILLMAQSLGLASIWRTGAIYDFPGVRKALRVREGATFVGALFLGYSAQREVKRRRTPAAEKTVWLAGDDGL